MKKEYINKKINEIIDKKNKLGESSKRRETLYYSSIALLGGLTIFSIPVLPKITLACGSMTAMIICNKYKKDKKTETKEKRYNSEINHLENLKLEDQIISEEQKEEKVSRLLRNSSKEKNIEQNYINATDLSMMSNFITIVGTIATVINPTYGWIALFGLCSNILSGYNEINKHKKRETLEKAISKLIYELDINEINIKTKEKTKERKEELKENKSKNYQINNILEETNEKEKPKIYQKKPNN